MKFQDINKSILKSNIFEFVYSGEAKFHKEEIVELIKCDDKIFITSENKALLEVNVKGYEIENILEDFFRKKNPSIITVQVINTQEKKIILDIHYFYDKISLDVKFCVEESFNQKVKEIKDDVIEELTRRFLIKNNDTTYALIGFYISKDESKNESILIHGKTEYLSLKKVESDEGIYYTVGKILKSIDPEKYVFKLAFGDIKFSDNTYATLARAEALNFFTETEKDISTYLNTWNEYGEIEKKLEYERFKNTGILKIVNSEPEKNGTYRLEVEENREKLEKFIKSTSKGSTLSIGSISPLELLSKFSPEIYLEFTKKNKYSSVALLECDISRFEIKVSVEEDVQIPKEGYIMLCLSGDMKRFERRENSRKLIFNGGCGIPNLSIFLQGKIPENLYPKKQNIKPLSDQVRSEVFPYHPPTENQIEAIKIALNTPDLAIIQGPPGTGKTTVITAIIKRLNELDKTKEKNFGRNLVTAYQHDAVENATERMDIMGIPVPKYGKKYGQQEDIANKTTFIWMERNKIKLEEAYPELKNMRKFSEYELLYKDYINSSNSIESTLNILKKAKIIFFKQNKEKLFQNSLELIEEIEYEFGKSDKNMEDLRRAYSLPYNNVTYADNGKETINRVLRYFERIKSKNSKKLFESLQTLIDTQERDEVFFRKLEQIRQNIILKLLPVEKIFLDSKQRKNVSDLLKEGLDKLKEDYEKKYNSTERIVREYLDELYNNPGDVENALNNYRTVIGATCQQAVSEKIIKLKGEVQNYANVLIDEAARSNPLDLFIPMAKAEERIILVGDHRQLPHIVDESIVKEIEKDIALDEDIKNIKEKISSNIEESLFKRMFINLKKLEEKDGIRRTITLDKQYRTHPLLGDFISANFYEKNGETKVHSPRHASEFSHSLPGLENKACVWMDVPFSKGEEIQGQSKSRPVEAKKIAIHLKEMLDKPESEKMSFGVITFYSKQKDIIMKELFNVGIALRTDEGDYEIKHEYQFKDGNEKIRVGTVDSFQGMEFDIVYLSVVRSNRIDAFNEMQKIKKYGHLMSDNRLCVSMSRQKKMLIVAGDSEMILNNHGKEAVTALYNYYNMCKEEKIYGSII